MKGWTRQCSTRIETDHPSSRRSTGENFSILFGSHFKNNTNYLHPLIYTIYVTEVLMMVTGEYLKKMFGSGSEPNKNTSFGLDDDLSTNLNPDVGNHRGKHP